MSEFDAQVIIDQHDGKCKTGEGMDVTQLTRFDAAEENYPLKGVMDGAVEEWTLEGKWSICIDQKDLDLIMPRTVVSTWDLQVSNRISQKAKHISVSLYSDDTVESEVVK